MFLILSALSLALLFQPALGLRLITVPSDQKPTDNERL
jgi:hypothetical protein